MAEWYLHSQNPDFLVDHEYSIFLDSSPVVLADTLDHTDVLVKIVELLQVCNDYADEKIPLDIMASTVKRLFPR